MRVMKVQWLKVRSVKAQSVAARTFKLLRSARHEGGFTLIELIVVMAIVALLVSIAAPRYVQSVGRAREASLRSSLAVMRDAIDRFAADRGRFPESLDELVSVRYLRAMPEDPFTGRRDTWVLLEPPTDSHLTGRVGDVRSGAAGQAADGVLYADW
jgi:general secretion pathway protein G